MPHLYTPCCRPADAPCTPLLLPQHFAAFVLTFRLVDAKDLTPLRELIQTMLGRERVNKGTSRAVCWYWVRR